MAKLRTRKEFQFLGALLKANRPLALLWYGLLLARGVLPAFLAIATGVLVSAVKNGDPLAGPLAFVGSVFVLYQILAPLHRTASANLGSKTSAWLNDRLMVACTTPTGMAHLERADLIDDLVVARDFDLGIMGPPRHISIDFIATGLVELVVGFASAMVLFAFAWWAPIILLAGWGSTHWLLRESAVWADRDTPEVRDAQRHAEYAYRLAVDAPAAKELRLFGLAPWVVDRFSQRRRLLQELRWRATQLRERSMFGALLIVLGANLLVAWRIAVEANDGRIGLGAAAVFLTTMTQTSTVAFGGFGWALDGAAAPVAAVLKLEASMAAAGMLESGTVDASGKPSQSIRFNDVTFSYRDDTANVLDGFTLEIRAGESIAIVGVNGAGKTTLAKLLCRLYDPQGGSIEVDGVNLREFDIDSWRSRVTAVFQDFVQYERSLRSNVAPLGASDEAINAALRDAGAADLAELDTILAKGYPGGTNLSGGQWQRVALARALCSVNEGAGLVLLDEPTAQLDVRGESEIFERVLAATRSATTILVSHRFSTVRQADRICVVEHGKVVELGTHDELMAYGGRYQTMFEMQAAHFVEVDETGGELTYETL